MPVEFATFSGADASRDISGSIWGDCPIEQLMLGRGGWLFRDEFQSFQITPATTEGNWAAEHGYSQFSSTGGTIANDTTELGGAVAIGSDGDNEGCSFRTTSVPYQINLTKNDFWFEARILTSTIADTKHNIFLGLMENAALTATVPIAADGTMADQNLVGFHRLETAGNGGFMDTVYKANGVTLVTVQAKAVTLVAGTYTKLGMRFVCKRNIGQGAGYLYFYQDGTQLATAKLIPSANGTDFPNDVPLGLVFAVLNATGTTPGTSSIDWWQAAMRTP